MQDLVKLLKGVYLFEKLDNNALKKIAKITEKKTYSPTDILIYEGEKATSMYVIEFGSVKLLKQSEEQEQVIGMLGTGMHFGELPFIDNLERGLTIEALEKTTVYEIPYLKLKDELKADPKLAAEFYLEVAHFLSTRLRTITHDLAFSRDKNLQHF